MNKFRHLQSALLQVFFACIVAYYVLGNLGIVVIALNSSQTKFDKLIVFNRTSKQIAENFNPNDLRIFWLRVQSEDDIKLSLDDTTEFQLDCYIESGYRGIVLLKVTAANDVLAWSNIHLPFLTDYFRSVPVSASAVVQTDHNH